MHLSTLSTALLLGWLGAAQAHTVVHNVFRNGQSPGPGVGLRLTKVGWDNSPIKPYSDDMACGKDGSVGAARTIPFKPGDTVSFEYFHAKTGDHPEPYLDPSHAGPCSIMMKKVDSAVKDPAKGDGWFRIAYEDYNTETGRWCTDRVAEGGVISAVIPADLAGGDYLVRSELLALHAAANGDPQFYVACAQVFLESAGTAQPKDTVAIPSDAYANINDAAMKWNLYYGTEPANYPGYGPPTYVSSGTVDPNATPSVTQKDGLRPSNCLLEVRNWFATPEPTFNNEQECWKANENCWEQHKGCYEGHPVGEKQCDPWAARCKAREVTCKTSPKGPETKDLTPPGKTITPPAPFDSGNNKVQAQSNSGSSGSSSAQSSPTASPSSSGDLSSGDSYGYGDASSSQSTPSTTASDAAASPSETKAADSDASIPDPDSKIEEDSSPEPSPASSSAASEETCASVITETVTEMVTVTATATADAASSGNAESYGYRRYRRAL